MALRNQEEENEEQKKTKSEQELKNILMCTGLFFGRPVYLS